MWLNCSIASATVWRVNQRCHFFDVVDEESVKEDLVGVLQSSQVDMSLEIIVFFLKSLVSTDGLLIKGFYVWRQKALLGQILSSPPP